MSLKKQFGLFILGLIISLSIFTNSAQAAQSGDFTYTVIGSNAEITDYTGSSSILNIPGTLDSYTVTSIGSGAFDNTSLTNVTIPDSVTNIGAGAFYNTSTLASVTLGSGVTTIGDSAFASTGLTSITIPDNVTSIGSHAFGTTLLTSVITGNGITTISNGMFSYISTLTSVTLGSSITTIGDDAFAGTGLTSITIPGNITSIGSSPFNNTPLENVIIMGSGLSIIPDYAFYDISTLTSVTLGSGVTTIGEYSFYGTGLTSITIPDSVTSIGDSAFASTGLTSITIPDSVTSIESGAFNNTPLESIIIGNSLNIIPSGMFASISTLANITLGSGITTIGSGAFYGTGLTSITIPDNVTDIGDNAFAEISALTRATFLGDAPATMGSGIFDGAGSSFKIYYLAGKNGFTGLGSEWNTYTTQEINLPTLSTSSSTLITATTATLNSSIANTGGDNSTVVGFNYGTTNLYGAIIPKETGSYGVDELFSSNITGLACNTTYHYRAYATNIAGTGYGEDQTFKTGACSPTLSTSSSTLITATTATLNSSIANTGGDNSTVVGFNYGTTNLYGAIIPKETGSYGVDELFSSNITGLACNTTYHYRAYATNSAGTGYGGDQTFDTLACDEQRHRSSGATGSSAAYIATFKAQQQATTNPVVTTNPAPINVTKTLKYKMIDPEVKILQEYLNSRGFLVSQTGAGSQGHETAYFGLKTKAAVILFQKANGLKPDGIVGPLTREKMK